MGGEKIDIKGGNVGYIYIGENVITGLIDLNISVFLLSKIIDKEIELSIRSCLDDQIKTFKKIINIDNIYVTYFASNLNNFPLQFTIPKFYIASTQVKKSLKNFKGNDSTLPEGFYIENLDLNLEMRENVIACLKQAFFNGVKDDLNTKVAKNDVFRSVETLYSTENLVNNDRKCFVVKKGGEFCGHVLFELIRIENQVAIKLIDVYILEPYKNKGLAIALTNKVENYSKKLKVKWIVGTVEGETSRRNNILKSLHKENWVIKSMTFRKDN